MGFNKARFKYNIRNPKSAELTWSSHLSNAAKTKLKRSNNSVLQRRIRKIKKARKSTTMQWNWDPWNCLIEISDALCQGTSNLDKGERYDTLTLRKHEITKWTMFQQNVISSCLLAGISSKMYQLFLRIWKVLMKGENQYRKQSFYSLANNMKNFTVGSS